MVFNTFLCSSKYSSKRTIHSAYWASSGIVFLTFNWTNFFDVIQNISYARHRMNETAQNSAHNETVNLVEIILPSD